MGSRLMRKPMRMARSVFLLASTVAILEFLPGCMGDCVRWETLGGRTICTVRHGPQTGPGSSYKYEEVEQSEMHKGGGAEKLLRVRRENHLPDLDPLWDSLLKQVFVKSKLAYQDVLDDPIEDVLGMSYYEFDQRVAKIKAMRGERAHYTSMRTGGYFNIHIWGADNAQDVQSMVDMAVAVIKENPKILPGALSVRSTPGTGAITTQKLDDSQSDIWHSWTAVGRYAVYANVSYYKSLHPEGWPDRPDPVIDKVVEFLASRQ